MGSFLDWEKNQQKKTERPVKEAGLTREQFKKFIEKWKKENFNFNGDDNET